MEMLVKMAKVFVKIAVMMMMATAAFRRHRMRGGEGPPSSSSSLTPPPRWEEGFPSGPWPPWHGRGESPSEIGSISLFLSGSAFSSGSVSPFRIYIYGDP